MKFIKNLFLVLATSTAISTSSQAMQNNFDIVPDEIVLKIIVARLENAQNFIPSLQPLGLVDRRFNTIIKNNSSKIINIFLNQKDITVRHAEAKQKAMFKALLNPSFLAKVGFTIFTIFWGLKNINAAITDPEYSLEFAKHFGKAALAIYASQKLETAARRTYTKNLLENIHSELEASK